MSSMWHPFSKQNLLFILLVKFSITCEHIWTEISWIKLVIGAFKSYWFLGRFLQILSYEYPHRKKFNPTRVVLFKGVTGEGGGRFVPSPPFIYFLVLCPKRVLIQVQCLVYRVFAEKSWNSIFFGWPHHFLLMTLFGFNMEMYRKSKEKSYFSLTKTLNLHFHAFPVH